MPIIAHAEAHEIPWRPGYRRFALAGKEQGVECSASYSVLEPGAGAPLHRHEVDEIIVVLSGILEVAIDGERRLVEADHTISIPAGVAHRFAAIGSDPAKILVFLPKQGSLAATTYLDGEPPADPDRR